MRHVSPHPRVLWIKREEADPRTHATRHGRDERILGVEDRDAVGLRDPCHGRLDLGQLRKRVDTLEVEVVGADVRQDRRLVRLVADALEHDSAACRLQYRHLDRGILEDAPCSGRPGQVSRLDQLLVEQDAV